MNEINDTVETPEPTTTPATAPVKRGRGRPKTHTDVPSFLTCAVTGAKVKTTPAQFRKQLTKSGKTSEEFQATYVSRAGRKVVKDAAAEEVKVPAEPVAPEAPAVTE